jgi:N-acetylglutamate synthase-like GNAT family acetyltransferase
MRAALSDDLGAARVLLAACDLPVDGLEDQFGEGYAVVESRGCVIGIAGVEIHGRFGLLRSVGVTPGARGSGVGAELVHDRVLWSRARGLEGLFLLTTTAADYFARHGFATVGRDTAPIEIRESREFSQSCPASATLMRLDPAEAR